jgi:hypothetical protein
MTAPRAIGQLSWDILRQYGARGGWTAELSERASGRASTADGFETWRKDVGGSASHAPPFLSRRSVQSALGAISSAKVKRGCLSHATPQSTVGAWGRSSSPHPRKGAGPAIPSSRNPI